MGLEVFNIKQLVCAIEITSLDTKKAFLSSSKPKRNETHFHKTNSFTRVHPMIDLFQFKGKELRK